MRVVYLEPLPPDVEAVVRECLPEGFSLRVRQPGEEPPSLVGQADFPLVATTPVTAEVIAAASSSSQVVGNARPASSKRSLHTQSVPWVPLSEKRRQACTWRGVWVQPLPAWRSACPAQPLGRPGQSLPTLLFLPQVVNGVSCSRARGL